MFGGQPVVRHERFHASTSSLMADEMPEGLRRSPIKPTAMNMQDRVAGPGPLDPAPPAGNASHSIGFIGNAGRGNYPFHDAVEGNAGRRPLQASSVGFNDSPHGGHRSVVFCTDR